MVHPRVLRALSTPLVGHLDPAFLGVMNDIQALLRGVFQTNNRLPSRFPAPAQPGWKRRS